MTYRTIPTKEFERDFRKLDSHFQERIKNKMREVAEHPDRYKHLKFDLRGSCRIRIDKLRVVFSYDEQKKEIYLEHVVLGHHY